RRAAKPRLRQRQKLRPATKRNRTSLKPSPIRNGGRRTRVRRPFSPAFQTVRRNRARSFPNRNGGTGRWLRQRNFHKCFHGFHSSQRLGTLAHPSLLIAPRAWGDEEAVYEQRQQAGPFANRRPKRNRPRDRSAQPRK